MTFIGHRATINARLLAAAGAFALCSAVPLAAQSAGCASPFAATSKLFDKPFHLYMVDSSQANVRLHGGRPTNSESVFTGTAYYVMVRGRWMKSPVDIAEIRKNELDPSTREKTTCSHLRDEPVNGEPAVVWRMHKVTEDGTSDTDVWVSRSSGLVLKSDIHGNVGGAFGKTHVVSRYEYANVRPPAGVR